MFLTVAIPVYNAERYIRQSIESVLNQSFTDFELIITDDGSSDGSLEIIRTFKDSRIKIVSDGQHKGLAIRLNEQIAMAQGQYFVRMDADDVMLLNRLERQAAFVREHPEIDVVGSSAIVIDEDGNQIGWRSCCRWRRGAGRKLGRNDYVKVNSFMHPTVMGRTKWFRNFYYNPACEGCEDRDLWLRSSRTSTFYAICEPLLYYRDVQHLNLQTYLSRLETGRYVLKLNSDTLPWWQFVCGSWSCLMKGWIARLMNLFGQTGWILKARNENISPINNHVLHVITSLRTGGAEKLMVDLLPRLRDRGHQVELVVFDGVMTTFYQELEQKGVKIHAFGKNTSVYNPLHILRLRRLMKHADLVHTHNTSPQLFAALANIGLKTALVTTEHNTSNRRRNKAWLRPADRWMYRQYNRIICISEQAKLNLIEYLPELFEKTSVIYNGIDVGRYMQSIGSVGPVRHSVSSNIVVTMVAAFREQKDQPTLIKAMALLPERYRLVLVGTGDENLMDACRSLAEALGVASRVTFLGMRNDVPELLSASDVVVLSSHYEGLSLSSLEGMASGRPFIASDVDGLHEIVAGYGVLFPHEDAEALAASIESVAEDPKLAQMIAEKSMNRARMYDIGKMADQYDAVYKE